MKDYRLIHLIIIYIIIVINVMSVSNKFKFTTTFIEGTIMWGRLSLGCNYRRTEKLIKYKGLKMVLYILKGI